MDFIFFPENSLQEEYGRLFSFGTSSQIIQDWQFTVNNIKSHYNVPLFHFRRVGRAQ
jgi:hypothetical protein